MKKIIVSLLIAMAILSLTLAACGSGHDEANGDMAEKMAIFSLITFSVFSIILVSFGVSRQRDKMSSENVDLMQHGSVYPLTTADLTSYPVYVWDYRSSFHKIVFHPDGVLSKSSTVFPNGLDPTVSAAGRWNLTVDGKVTVTLDSTGTTKTYTRISKNTSTVRMQPDFGLLELWYFGPGSLANIEISILGYSESAPAAVKFTTAFVSGRTFYWTTYPYILVTTSGEVAVNEGATYGMITFKEDGVLSKSIDNKIRFVPDYTPSISGAWSVDEQSGVLTMTVLGFTSTASILTQESEYCELHVITSAGNRLWFYEPTNALDKLTTFIS